MGERKTKQPGLQSKLAGKPHNSDIFFQNRSWTAVHSCSSAYVMSSGRELCHVGSPQLNALGGRLAPETLAPTHHPSVKEALLPRVHGGEARPILECPRDLVILMAVGELTKTRGRSRLRFSARYRNGSQLQELGSRPHFFLFSAICSGVGCSFCSKALTLN
jgi:hypothetical protein